MTAPAEPLADHDRQRLARWSQRLRILLAIGVGLVVLWVLGVAIGEPPWLPVLGSAATFVLVITGVAAQVGLRCPRCGTRVMFRPGLALPGRCAVCGVAFGPDRE